MKSKACKEETNTRGIPDSGTRDKRGGEYCDWLWLGGGRQSRSPTTPLLNEYLLKTRHEQKKPLKEIIIDHAC
jgi:sugar lactone lactonase YvrE